jgi:GT2 family glycosyltransferase
VVVYRPDLDALAATVASLREAVRRARDDGVLGDVSLDVIDNGSEEAALDAALRDWTGSAGELAFRGIRGHGNVGYGRGHNLSIGRSTATYHLVLNPDVVLDPLSLKTAVEFLEAHPDVSLLTPQVRGTDGDRQYLCRRYPSLLTLALRGFAPAPLRARFSRRLDHYELRDDPPSGVRTDIDIATGCFMFARGSTLRRIGGFADEFFLYFEDYDLSLRLRKEAAIAYVEDVRIVHGGGGVPRKGWRHIVRYVRSAMTFFSKHGWKIL